MHLAASIGVAEPSQAKPSQAKPSQARAMIGRWIRYYNEERPHQFLGYVAPRAHPALAG
ncbi:integrase core domain-containing protein [Halomonas denitrificans]|uniref:integrase core domain-containing protein n=1 Tax=Halomonas denitrificans TaxID=370769 RepID=UPI003965641F